MDDDLDRILSDEQDVAPSSAFVENVMAVLRREASTPAPISFPWRRVAPGLAICAASLISLIVIFTIQFREGMVLAGPLPRAFANVVADANSIGLEWIALALVASYVPTRLVLERS
jgi:hypothetical protein